MNWIPTLLIGIIFSLVMQTIHGLDLVCVIYLTLFILNLQENVGGTTYFYSPEDYSVQREGIVSILMIVPLEFEKYLSMPHQYATYNFNSFHHFQPSCNEVAAGGRMLALTRQRSQFLTDNIIFGRKHYYIIIQSEFEIQINLLFFSCKIMVFYRKSTYFENDLC